MNHDRHALVAAPARRRGGVWISHRSMRPARPRVDGYVSCSTHWLIGAQVLFVSDVLKHETAPKQVDRMRAVAAKWGSMSDVEKAPYQRRAAEAKAAMS